MNIGQAICSAMHAMFEAVGDVLCYAELSRVCTSDQVLVVTV